MIKLFVIEDHTDLIVSSLKYRFRSKRDGISIAGSANSVDNAIKSVDRDTLDLFILDLFIPDDDPIENIRKLKSHFPDKPIVVYTGIKSEGWRKKMMKEGASSYITKDSRTEDLKFAILKAANGEVIFFGEKDEGENQQKNGSTSTKSLTPIQRDIIESLAKGKSHEEIAEEIGISRSMVEKILKKIRQEYKAKKNIDLLKTLFDSGSF